MKKNRRILLALAAALVLLLAACGEKASLTVEDNDITGGIDVTATKASGERGSGRLIIGEGDCLVISPFLDKGAFQVTILDEAGETVLEQTVDGRVMVNYSLGFGTYEVRVTGEGGATGTMAIMPYSIQSLTEEDQQLQEGLEAAQENLEDSQDGEDLPEETEMVPEEAEAAEAPQPENE